MNYARVYAEFIADRRKKEPARGKSDRHHIVPRSMGGSEANSNLIRLSYQDHLFAHVLLWKIHGKDAALAVRFMLNCKKYSGRHSRGEYQRLRDDFSEACKGRSILRGEDHWMFGHTPWNKGLKVPIGEKHHLFGKPGFMLGKKNPGAAAAARARRGQERPSIQGENHPLWGKPSFMRGKPNPGAARAASLRRGPLNPLYGKTGPDHPLFGRSRPDIAANLKARHGLPKLTPEKVQVIRLKASDGQPLPSLAEEFDMGLEAIKRIVDRRTWKSVPDLGVVNHDHTMITA